MFACSFVQMFAYSRVQLASLFKGSNVQMFKCSNVRLFKCSLVQGFNWLRRSNVRLFFCSNVQMFACSRFNWLRRSNAQMFACSNVRFFVSILLQRPTQTDICLIQLTKLGSKSKPYVLWIPLLNTGSMHNFYDQSALWCKNLFSFSPPTLLLSRLRVYCEGGFSFTWLASGSKTLRRW